MKNDGRNAKLLTDQISCDLDDVEICERGVDEISTVDPEGMPERHKETYMGEARFAYYYCNSCTQSWSNQDFDTQEKAWVAVKEHLNGEG